MRHQLSVRLSHLVADRRNPRKVKVNPEADQRLVALIRSQGLIQPLVVRPDERPKHYRVIAGKRRLAALREVYRGQDPQIDCVVRDVDAATADALALGENFGREPMHPQDEAEAFAKLAANEGKGSGIIAAEFGVEERYVRQRMKLATLATVVKTAYRDGQIDTATAEAFASVPEEKQVEVWKEMGGNPRHAEHVRNVIANDWIDAKHAIFDIAALSEEIVSRDLFSERVLVERQAFMQAQADAITAQHQSLTEDGWKEVVIGKREDVQDRLLTMDMPEREFDPLTAKKLEKIAARKQELEQKAGHVKEDDEPGMRRLQKRFDVLESAEHEIVKDAPAFISEETKAIATAFLILDPDGRVHREIRVPRRKRGTSANGNGHAIGDDVAENVKTPTSDDLCDRQLSTTFTHQALAVREAVLKDNDARTRLLALILHDKVRSEALAIRHDANGTSVHASTVVTFKSAAYDQLTQKRTNLDPFTQKHRIEDVEGYEALGNLSAGKLGALIDLLIVECITAHMTRRTPLVEYLATQLKVNIRDYWRPDAEWLSGYQKIQLAHLMTELMGVVHAPAPERKKSELVELLATLFADAADGKLEDKELAGRVNTWIPANLRDEEGGKGK
jgi:ParB family transcriptional regulator, chromosome partitioning protein